MRKQTSHIELDRGACSLVAAASWHEISWCAACAKRQRRLGTSCPRVPAAVGVFSQWIEALGLQEPRAQGERAGNFATANLSQTH